MPDDLILTPTFLDQPQPAFLKLVPPPSQVIQPPLPQADTQDRLSVIHLALARAIQNSLRHGRRPVSFAGDCVSTLAVAAALQRENLQPTLLWLDAHGDFNTWETTPSGFLGGMPLAMLVGRGEQRMPVAVGLRPWPENNVVLSDARDLDPGEREAVAASQIHHVRELGRVSRLLPDGPLWVHFDVDVINPLDAPAMKYRAPGGPRADELEALFAALAASGRVIAISLSAWDPELDHDATTARVCLHLLHILQGQQA